MGSENIAEGSMFSKSVREGQKMGIGPFLVIEENIRRIKRRQPTEF